MTTIDTQTVMPPATPKTDGEAAVLVKRLVRGHLSATLYLGDCLEIAPQLQGIDAVISDPPYGIGFQHSGGGKGKGKGRWLSKTCTIHGDDKPFDPAPWLEYPIIVLWGADHYAQRLPEGGWLIWDKLGGRNGFGDNFSDIEAAWQKQKRPSRIFRHLWKGLIRQGLGGVKRVHVSEKPVPLMAWSMEMADVPTGATVLDPYMGSGTTGLACLRTDHNFAGIEIDPEYFKTACARLEREVNQYVLL